MSYDDKFGATPSVLTLSYMLNVGKNVVAIVLHIIALVDENDMVFDE